MFYFDTIGTALASLLGGATSGVSVAFATNIIGAKIAGAPGYAYFGFSNATAALVWAMVPRLGFRILGSDILHPIPKDGYARQLTRVIALGLLVAVGASLSATIVQVFILSMKLDAINFSIEAVSGGNYVSRNNILLVAALIQSFDYNELFKNPFATFFAASLTSNIPDKIMSTSAAVVLIIAFFRIPRINVQASAIKKNPDSAKGAFNNGMLYFIVCFVCTLYYVLVTSMRDNTQLLAFLFFIILFWGCGAYRGELMKVYDPYEKNASRPRMFYPSKLSDQKLSFQKDVFEDALKTIQILFLISQFIIIYRILPGVTDPLDGAIESIPIKLDGQGVDFQLPSMAEIILYNIIILTSFRYAMMIFIRFFGRF